MQSSKAKIKINIVLSVLLLIAVLSVGAVSFAWFRSRRISTQFINFGKIELSTNNSSVSGVANISNAVPGQTITTAPLSFSKAESSDSIFVRCKLKWEFSDSLSQSDKTALSAFLQKLNDDTNYNIISINQSGAKWSTLQNGYVYLLDNATSDIYEVNTTNSYTLTNSIVVPTSISDYIDDPATDNISKSFKFVVEFQAIQSVSLSGQTFENIVNIFDSEFRD